MIIITAYFAIVYFLKYIFIMQHIKSVGGTMFTNINNNNAENTTGSHEVRHPHLSFTKYLE
jgi:hypothetical protein